jgi:hypothetical protein
MVTDTPAALLHDAVAFASAAPSVRNSRPWRWQVDGPVLDLTLDRDRVLDRADPYARLAVLSCGAALHHAVAHLAAGGWRAGVQRMPDHRRPDHLARLELAGRIPVDPAAARMVAAAGRGRTARPGAPLDRARLRPILLAARRHGADLRVLRPNQIFALAAAFEDAGRVQNTPQPARAAGGVPVAEADGGRAEHAARATGSGIERDAEREAGRDVKRDAERDAGRDVKRETGRDAEGGIERGGAVLIGESHHRAAVFAVLHGAGDDREDWLRGGEALSAAWLTAAVLELSVLPLSAVIEVATAREAVRRLLERPGRPYLVLRFATAEPGIPAPRAPR